MFARNVSRSTRLGLPTSGVGVGVQMPYTPDFLSRLFLAFLSTEKTPPCGVSALCVSDDRVRALVEDAPGNYVAENDRGEKL